MIVSRTAGYEGKVIDWHACRNTFHQDATSACTVRSRSITQTCGWLREKTWIMWISLPMITLIAGYLCCNDALTRCPGYAFSQQCTRPNPARASQDPSAMSDLEILLSIYTRHRLPSHESPIDANTQQPAPTQSVSLKHLGP